ncbi:unnamed protein product [Jaminaea pallidilutea]
MLPVLAALSDFTWRDAVSSCSDGVFGTAARTMPDFKVDTIFFVRPRRYRAHTETRTLQFWQRTNEMSGGIDAVVRGMTAGK